MTPADLVVGQHGTRFHGRHFPSVVGRGGFTSDKTEGDGATPLGTHHIVGMLFRADRMARPAAWAIPIGPSDLWSDDSDDQDYNHMVRAPYASSHERLRRADPLYDLVLITDWNWPNAQKGKGSAIFIHTWRRPHFPTEGCVALRSDHLRWIARRVHYQSRVIICG